MPISHKRLKELHREAVDRVYDLKRDIRGLNTLNRKLHNKIKYLEGKLDGQATTTKT
jgi:hypothetical protein